MADPTSASGDSATMAVRVAPARARPSDETSAAFVPTGPSAERSFFQERLAFFFLIAWIASSGFLVMRIVLNAVAERSARGAPLERFPFFHLVATSILFFDWLLARSAPSDRALRWIDAFGTIAAAFAYAAMERTMPLTWRPDQLVLLIANAVLLGRAALVPSAPRRTAWITAISVLPMPVVAFELFRNGRLGDLVPGAVVTQATLWSVFLVILATLISNVTFHLRRSVAKARRLGQYTLIEKIGQGGMGVVYRAEHQMLRRPTAIKLLPPHSASEENLRRFEREAQMTARLVNPHTVSVFDFGRTPEGAFYYVMEYLDGIDLERLVRETGPMPPGRVVNVLRQVCEALFEAHGIGLVHRDIKPANILLNEQGGIPDFAKVVDFGLVKDVLGSKNRQLTQEGVLAGTLHYLSPESIREAGSPDPRSDLYALGGVAYYMLTATRVFDGRAIDIIQAHLDTPPEPPSERLGLALPAKLESVVLDCLAKDPNLRPESAEVLGERLAACDDVAPWTAEQARDWWRARKSA